MSQIATKRLQRELSELQKNPPANIRLVEADQLNKWIVEFTGAEGSLYAGEHFLLQFKFPSDYPIDSPEVIFLKPNIPVHPHVYTNGHMYVSRGMFLSRQDLSRMLTAMSPNGGSRVPV
ncbi:ubiquitin-conjugating enzyme/RWD-like protein [Catenaria anguillulae PL171]|uniref:Ubiquitin-conjugating enzyme/RWD-like protein n=1 Tax=Catenaria anguillulae PL171 TaxID=765915 RepID=A0A1Y2HHB5_9FUNG|nr:ubiquitin-conjugating enzyme/RWD-like protein [Catenaria anguillulae PL171]